MASTSYRARVENDTLVGDVYVTSSDGVSPIRGDERDDTIVSSDERRPRAVCQHENSKRGGNTKGHHLSVSELWLHPFCCICAQRNRMHFCPTRTPLLG